MANPCDPQFIPPLRALFTLFPNGFNVSGADSFVALAELRVKITRILISWRFGEPIQGVFNWAPSDNVVRAAHGIGVQLIYTFLETPDWANGGAGKQFPPDDVSSMFPFVEAATARYRPGGDFARQEGWSDGYGVVFWEIWNEPNLADFWPPDPHVAKYTAMLRGSYTAAKAGNPKCQVLFAGLANTGSAAFFKGMYNNGAKGYFDIACCHPFGNSASEVEDLVDRIQGVLDANGESTKPIWATEMQLRGGSTSGMLEFFQVVMPTGKLKVGCWTELWDHDAAVNGLLRKVGSMVVKKPQFFAYRDQLPEP